MNKPKRLEYALKCIRNRENFHDVIFTDESTIKIQTYAKRSMYKEGERRQLKRCSETSLASPCLGGYFETRFYRHPYLHGTNGLYILHADTNGTIHSFHLFVLSFLTDTVSCRTMTRNMSVDLRFNSCR